MGSPATSVAGIQRGNVINSTETIAQLSAQVITLAKPVYPNQGFSTHTCFIKTSNIFSIAYRSVCRTMGHDLFVGHEIHLMT